MRHSPIESSPASRGLVIGLAAAALASVPVLAADPQTVGIAVAPRSGLPVDLDPWTMFVNADKLVQAILVGLAFASIVTWTVWLAKSIEIITARRRARTALAALHAAPDLRAARGAPVRGQAAASDFVEAAAIELERSGDGMPVEGIKERIGLSLQRIESAYVRRIQRGTGVLATIGATAPFVGLFGTVWGIMNSFVGIARMQTTNLAVVAPGIAEALLATAVGLAAAIPAVVVYNVFSRSIAGYRALMSDAAAEAMRLASRDLDRLSSARIDPTLHLGPSAARRAAE